MRALIILALAAGMCAAQAQAHAQPARKLLGAQQWGPGLGPSFAGSPSLLTMSMLPDYAGVPTSRRAVPGFGSSALQERGNSMVPSQGALERGNSLARLTQGGPLALANPLAANPLGVAGVALTDSLSRAAGSAMQRLGGGAGRWLLQWGGWGLPDTENDTKMKSSADTANAGFTEAAYGGARIVDARHTGTASITSAGFDAFGTAFPHTRKGEWPAPTKASLARSGNFAT